LEASVIRQIDDIVAYNGRATILAADHNGPGCCVPVIRIIKVVALNQSIIGLIGKAHRTAGCKTPEYVVANDIAISIPHLNGFAVGAGVSCNRIEKTVLYDDSRRICDEK
jgi:hypothetical protein